MMNVLLASGGYPWTVARVGRCATYMKTLEQASVNGEIAPLATFIAEQMRSGRRRASDSPPIAGAPSHLREKYGPAYRDTAIEATGRQDCA
jgi:hypothetical protein